MKKHLFGILTALVLGCTWLPAQADGYNYLTVTGSDGSEVSYALGTLKITFADGNMRVISGGETVGTHALAQLTKMYFTETNVAIRPVQSAAQTLITLESTDRLNVTLAAPARLSIYSADGTLQRTQKLKAGKQAVELGNLPAGIYLINVNGQTAKIRKK